MMKQSLRLGAALLGLSAGVQAELMTFTVTGTVETANRTLSQNVTLIQKTTEQEAYLAAMSPIPLPTQPLNGTPADFELVFRHDVGSVGRVDVELVSFVFGGYSSFELASSGFDFELDVSVLERQNDATGFAFDFDLSAIERTRQTVPKSYSRQFGLWIKADPIDDVNGGDLTNLVLLEGFSRISSPGPDYYERAFASTGSSLAVLTDNGANAASSPLPLPDAPLLMLSGLIGLLPLRRRLTSRGSCTSSR